MSADCEAISAIEKARLAGRAKLAGRSPKAVGREKDAAALGWVYRWGWSAPGIVDAVASPTRRGVAARLVKGRLMEAHDCEAAGGIKGIPHQILTLTPDGVAELETDLGEADLLPYPVQGARLIHWRQLRHDMLVQRWTAQKLADGKIVGYQTPREIAERSQPGVKQPDAVWILPTGARVAVEAELTAKFARELDQALVALLRSVTPASDNQPGGPYDLAAIISHSPGLLARYRRALTPGATIREYERTVNRTWQPSGSVTVPPWALKRLIFQEVRL